MGYGYLRRHTHEYLMKCIYFVTEGPTDQVVIEGLITNWLGKEDFIPRHIQPPSSAYTDGLNTNLSDGWKGVLAWCEGKRIDGPTGRDEAIKLADCLIIHTDADVATDADFKSPTFAGTCPPASNATNWVRHHLAASLGNNLPSKVVLCVPAKDLEAWVILCAPLRHCGPKHAYRVQARTWRTSCPAESPSLDAEKGWPVEKGNC